MICSVESRMQRNGLFYENVQSRTLKNPEHVIYKKPMPFYSTRREGGDKFHFTIA